MSDDVDQSDGEDLESLLRAFRRGDRSLEETRDRIRGIDRLEDYARIDARQGARTGIPEVVNATSKSAEEVIEIGRSLIDGAGRAIIAGPSRETRTALLEHAADGRYHERSGTLVAHGTDFDPPEHDGRVAVVTAGTSDIRVAEKVAVLAEEMGCTVDEIYDVGVSAIDRLFRALDRLDAADSVVVAAGREGALATVVAGLVSTPVIGLPVSTGEGHGGNGRAALMSMLQSCTVLTAVNVDAGFVAGGQAGLIAAQSGR